MDFETILILSAVLQVIILICFFVLCSNVSSIKAKVCRDGAPISTVVATLLAAGEKERAKAELLEFLIAKMNNSYVNAGSEVDIDNILNPYKGLMKAVDLNFDVKVMSQVKKMM